MPTLNDLIDGDAQRLDTGFTFTEGPLYHPDGFYYFVDVREIEILSHQAGRDRPNCCARIPAKATARPSIRKGGLSNARAATAG